MELNRFGDYALCDHVGAAKFARTRRRRRRGLSRRLGRRAAHVNVGCARPAQRCRGHRVSC